MGGEDYTGAVSGRKGGLQGRLALVTGGARRVGAAIVRELDAAGAEVIIHARRSASEARALASELERPGGVVLADLEKPEGAERLLDGACESSGGRHADLVVHAAASFRRGALLETSVAEWDRVQALNLRSCFLIAQGMARRRGAEGGDLIAIADAAALELWPGYLAHSVAKAGLLALVRALAKAMAPRFRVNAVVPGPVLLPEGMSEEEREAIRARTLLGRLGEPEHVARAVRFLAECDFATGAALEVTGGSHLWRGVPGGSRA